MSCLLWSVPSAECSSTQPHHFTLLLAVIGCHTFSARHYSEPHLKGGCWPQKARHVALDAVHCPGSLAERGAHPPGSSCSGSLFLSWVQRGSQPLPSPCPLQDLGPPPRWPEEMLPSVVTAASSPTPPPLPVACRLPRAQTRAGPQSHAL